MSEATDAVLECAEAEIMYNQTRETEPTWSDESLRKGIAEIGAALEYMAQHRLLVIPPGYFRCPDCERILPDNYQTNQGNCDRCRAKGIG